MRDFTTNDKQDNKEARRTCCTMTMKAAGTTQTQVQPQATEVQSTCMRLGNSELISDRKEDFGNNLTAHVWGKEVGNRRCFFACGQRKHE